MDNKPTVEQKLFTHGELRLNYAVLGKGKHTVLAFHGFGRTHEDFIRFTRPFQDRFTIYAFDIFFHGKSTVESRSVDQHPCSKKELGELFICFMRELKIERTALMGYSLGGRICLCLAEVIPKRVSALYLFAPDGLVLNRWYALLSHYALGRVAFRTFIEYNRPFYWILNGLKKSKVISQNLYDFVSSQIKTRESQELVYAVWVFLRKIEPNFKTLGEQLSKENIYVDLFFGQYDKIIPKKNAKSLEKLKADLQIHTLQSGHILLTGSNAALIKEENWLRTKDS